MNKKTAIITGAAKGIGRAIAITLAENGYNVVINYNTSEMEAKLLKKSLDDKGFESCIYRADISDEEQVKEMVKFTIANYNSIDVVINNAGICESKLFTDISKEDIQKMFDVTILGSFLLTKEVLKKYMINNKSGVIVNIASIWGVCGASCEVNYSTMKAGLIGMTKALAKELGPSNIRVNAIAPGIIDTDMNNNLTLDEKKAFIDELPIERIGTPQDVANMVKFIVSDEASYITGQVFNVDGGAII